MKLGDLIRQDRFASRAQEATLNILVTSTWMMGEISAALAPAGLTPAQYNVLRILNGAHPARMTCSEIGARLLDRTPDVTRLLNRLDKAGLISRSRSRTDRRVVRVGITDAGRDIVAELMPVMDGVQDRLARHLESAELDKLSEYLERLRSDQVA